MVSDFLKLYSETNVGNKRSANEDFLGYSTTPNGLLYVVCDGMGGHVGGATASQLAVKSIINFLGAEPFENIYDALRNAIVFANNEIYNHSLNNPNLKGMGTTCTVLIAREPEIFIAHVGDSRIYLQSDKKLYRLTKDHSYVQELVDQGVILDEDAENHPKKNQILKALGIREIVDPTVYLKAIHPKTGDRFLLCSDGLNGEINDEIINQTFNEEQDINIVGSNLINKALDAGGNDNITIEIIEVLDSPFEKSDFPNYNPVNPVITDTDFSESDLTSTIIDDSVSKNSKSSNTVKILVSLIIILVTVTGYLLTKNNNAINVGPEVKFIEDQNSKPTDSETNTQNSIDDVETLIDKNENLETSDDFPPENIKIEENREELQNNFSSEVENKPTIQNGNNISNLKDEDKADPTHDSSPTQKHESNNNNEQNPLIPDASSSIRGSNSSDQSDSNSHNSNQDSLGNKKPNPELKANEPNINQVPEVLDSLPTDKNDLKKGENPLDNRTNRGKKKKEGEEENSSQENIDQ